MSSIILFAHLSRLTAIAPQGGVAPELAESWDSNPELTEWIFVLRKGVQFSNGKALNVEDVIASLNVHRGHKTSPVRSIAAQIKDISAADPNTLRITLESANADLPTLLAAPQFGVNPLVDGALKTGIGTGPYIVDQFEPGIRCHLTRNPNHFSSEVGFFEEAEITFIPDAAARQSALLTGTVDVIDRPDVKTLDMVLQGYQNIKLLQTTGAFFYNFPMRTDIAPFGDNDVRLALKYAMDREEILAKCLKGYGALGNDHPISTAYRYCDTSIEQRKYDPDKAKFHLKKANAEGLKVELSAAENLVTGGMDAALLYKEQAKKAGIEINIKKVPDDGFMSNVWMKDPWVVSYWNGRPTEDWVLTQAYSKDSNWNETYWHNERFESLLKAGRGERDEDKRRQIYSDLQHLLRDEGASVIPFFAKFLDLHSDKVVHAEHVASNYDLDGYRFIERWWAA